MLHYAALCCVFGLAAVASVSLVDGHQQVAAESKVEELLDVGFSHFQQIDSNEGDTNLQYHQFVSALEADRFLTGKVGVVCV